MKLPTIMLVATAALLTSCAAAPLPDTTSRNRAIIQDFARMFYTDKNVKGAFEKHVVADYIQHNPGIADGREAAIAALAPKFSNPNAVFEVKRILVDGDLAAIHLFGRGDPATRGAAVADIYRLKDGKIVEHWDVLQPIPETSVNPHPMF